MGPSLNESLGNRFLNVAMKVGKEINRVNFKNKVIAQSVN
jgi:hypothetical protein